MSNSRISILNDGVNRVLGALKSFHYRSQLRMSVVLSAVVVLGAGWKNPSSSNAAEDAEQAHTTSDSEARPANNEGYWQHEFRRRKQWADAIPVGRIEAIYPLLGLLETLEGEIQSSQLVALIEGISSGDSQAHPLVRSYANYLRARLYENQGDIASARALYQSEGYLLSWKIIGPFENANRQGENQVYAPEQEAFHSEQSFIGKLPRESLSWRDYGQGNVRSGAYISFDEYLRPNVHVTGYATAWVHVSQNQDAELHGGFGGGHTVWVNGQEIGRAGTYKAPHPLQESYRLKLKTGWNRILIKLGVEEGLWGFYARLCNPDGSAISEMKASSLEPKQEGKNIESSAKAANKPPAESKSKQSKKSRSAGHGIRALLESQMSGRAGKGKKRRKKEARGQRASSDLKKLDPALVLAELYRWTHPYPSVDETPIEHVRDTDKRLQTAYSAFLLARESDDPLESRSALVSGINRAAVEGEHSRYLAAHMMLELALRDRELGLDSRYRQRLQQAQELAPDDVIVELARLDQMGDDGYSWSALTWLNRLLERYPHSETLWSDRVSRLLSMGRTREALSALESTPVLQNRPLTLNRRIQAYLRLGEVDEALKIAREHAENESARTSSHRLRSRVELAAGNLSEAAQALQDAIALSDLDPDLHRSLGNMLALQNRRDAVIRSYQRSLALDPQQPELRDQLLVLGAKGEDDIYQLHAVELKGYLGQNVPAEWAGKAAGIWREKIAVRVADSGLGERLEHRVIQILDDRGIRSQARQSTVYDPSESYVDVRAARILRADGQIEEVNDIRVASLAAAGYRMYYDQRQIEVNFPGLHVGDILEVAFVHRDISRRNKFDDYFGDLVIWQGTLPIKNFEYQLEIPKSVKLYFNRPLSSHTIGKERQTFRFNREDIPAIRPESGMPGWTDVAAYLYLSTYENWDDLANWYWGLVKEQLQVDQAIQNDVRKAVRSIPQGEELRRVHAIYRHVIQSTRYVGLEFGIHGYKPYRTTDVYQRRFGDCKDKASLLKVMLAEIGVQSHLVLLRTRDQGTLSNAHAGLAGFNHAIVYVPKYKLFLDGTAEFSGADELPSGDQGATALVVKDGEGGEFLQVPFLPASQNRVSHQQEIVLLTDGSAEVDYSLQVSGVDAASFRSNLQSKNERDEYMKRVLGQWFPGVEVKKSVYGALEDVLKPVELKFELKVPNWAKRNSPAQDAPIESSFRYLVLGRDSDLVAQIASQAKRDHALELGPLRAQHRKIQYRLPAGAKWSQVPTTQHVETRFGKLDLSVEYSETEATVDSLIEWSVTEIKPEEYLEFREFLHRVDQALQQAFEFSVANPNLPTLSRR